MGEANGGRARGARCLAIVGPFAGGKTTLLEAILARTGAIQRQGSTAAGNTVGDASPEARAQRMSVSLNVATAEFMGDSYTFLDCPGSVEFLHDMRLALPAVDAAIVVCEADEKKVPALQMILKELEDRGIPRFLFINKIEKADHRLRDTLTMLQPASRAPLVLRQIPIWRNDIVIGSIDLARDLREGLIVPVLIGSAEHGNGILRLLKALRHEAPGIEGTLGRLGMSPNGQSLVHVFKTIHAGHGGKLSVGRVL